MEITTWDEHGENRIVVCLNTRDATCRDIAFELLETLIEQEEIEQRRGSLKKCPRFFRGGPPGFDARDPNDPADYEADARYQMHALEMAKDYPGKAKFELLDEDGKLPPVNPLLNELAAKVAKEHPGAYMGPGSRPDSALDSGMRIRVAEKLPTKIHPLPPSYLVAGEPTPTDRQVEHIRLDNGEVGQITEQELATVQELTTQEVVWDNNLLDPPRLMLIRPQPKPEPKPIIPIRPTKPSWTQD